MNQTRREREALLPATGELAGQLFLSPCQAEPLNAGIHRVPAILYLVHASHETEILGDAQVLPKTKLLRHVSYLALDGLALENDVITETGAAARIRPQK